jgi:hypothetical protein
LKLRDLRKLLKRHGVSEEPSKGKGSHTTFVKTFPDGTFTYPVPTAGASKEMVLICYVKGCRKRFRLRKEDGISDKDFYGK